MSSSQSPFTPSNEATTEIVAGDRNEETSQEGPSTSTQPYTTTAFYAPATAPGAPAYTSSNAPDASEDFDSDRLMEVLGAALGYDPTATSYNAIDHAAAEQTGAGQTTTLPSVGLPSSLPLPSTEPAATSTQPALSQHQSELETNRTANSDIEKPFGCDFCGRRFARKSSKQRHERSVHADLLDLQDQPQPEDTSDPAVILTQPTLSQQQSELGTNRTTEPEIEKPFTCDFCDRRFTRYFSKRRHERCAHADLDLQNQPRPENASTANPAAEKPFSCDHCSRRFRSRCSKERHERVAHPEVDSGAQQPVEERLSCDYCSRTFKNTYQKKRHERENHTAPRSLTCSVCGKTFKRNDALKTHMVMSHGTKLPEGPLPRPSNSTMSPHQALEQPHVEQEQQTQQQEEHEQRSEASLEQRGEERQENPRKRSRDGQEEDSGDELLKRFRMQPRRSRSP